MKKGLYNGKIKQEYISYITVTIVLFTAIFIGGGALFTWIVLSGGCDEASKMPFLITAALSLLIGIVYPILSIYVIRNYPKYEKLRRQFILNSDYYFVGSDDRTYHGHIRYKGAFDAVTAAGDHESGKPSLDSNPELYKKYNRCVAITVIGIAMMFVILLVVCLIVDMEKEIFEPIDYIILATFITAEVIDFTVSLIFAFKVNKIRNQIKNPNTTKGLHR